MPRELSDKVTKNGETYCSPHCGGGCEYSEYLEMKKQGQRMCKELGRGWKIDLTHNLGWYCRVKKRSACVHYEDDRTGQNRRPNYSGWIEFQLGGRSFQFINNARTATAALHKSQLEAKRLMKKITIELDSLEI